MKTRLRDLEAATAAVRPFLPQYLQEHGLDTNKNFLCLNPKHEDQAPSMTVKQDPEHAYCFGCGQTCDILTAAHFLEGKPLKGRGFIDDNLLYLAEKYGVDLEMADLTPEEVYEYRTYRAYALAADLVSDPNFGNYKMIRKEIKARGWDPQRLAEWGIGTVNFQEFRETLKQAGYEPGFLGGVDLDRSNLFNEENLLFTVYDEHGRPVGFSARNLKYKPGDTRAGPKYNNTRVTGLECNIFRKGERLYGFELAKDASSPLHLFEGQADVVTARHHGYMNCACTMGTNLTDHHISLLKKHGIFDMVLVFDSDEGGETAIQKMLDEKLAPHNEFRIKLIHLPAGMDPDQLFREKGAEEFARLKRWEAFEWRLQQFADDTDPEEIAQKVIPLILSDKNYLRHEKMAKILARRTGFDLSTIMGEIKRQRSERDAELTEKKKGILEDALWRAQRNPEEAHMVLTEARAHIEDVQRKFGDNTMAASTVLDFVLTQKEEDEKKTGEFAGFHLKPEGLGGIGARLNDNWRSDHWLTIGGQSQAGKTTLAAQLAYEIASDERNNAMVIYHSIDDAARFILYKLICNAADDLSLQLGHITNPNYWSLQEGYEFVKGLREKGYRRLIQLVKDQRIVLKDATESSSLAYSENMLRYYREVHRDRNIVLVIDNFHKLPDYPNKNGHERIKTISNHVKEIATTHKATVITTMEYRKIYDNALPQNSDLADSRSMDYDCTCILHLHNDVHSKQGELDKAVLVHRHGDILLPRVRVGFGKNKISGYDGREFLDFYPSSATMRAVDLKTAEQDQLARKEFLAGEKKKGRQNS